MTSPTRSRFPHPASMRSPRAMPLALLGPLSLAFLPFLAVLGALSAAEPQESKINTVVSILPQAYFVERVGAGRVAVQVLVGPGQSPHTFEPTPKQMADLAQARLYFGIGVPFETRLLDKIRAAYPDLRIVDTAQGIPLRQMTESDEPEEPQGQAGRPPSLSDGAAQGQPDPHIWLDPMLVKIQARHICEALSQTDPAHASEYEANLEAFEADLEALHGKIAESLAPLKGRELFVFHPAFGYFAQRYGLKQVAVETGGREPGARRIVALIDQAKRRNVKVIFVQPQFSPKTARAVAKAIGGVVAPIDPLAPDYLKNLETMAQRIQEGLSAER